MIPLAFGLVIGAVSSIKLSARFGTTLIVAAGLANLGGMLGMALFWSADMPYLPLGFWFFGVAVSLGWVTGPATDSVMGAVPEEKSGVASAMNDVTRQVAGALGTAIVGSLITSLYASRIGDAVAGLPEQARTAAEAFTHAMGAGFLVAGLVATLAAIAVKRWLPARHRDAPTAAVVELPARLVVHEQPA